MPAEIRTDIRDAVKRLAPDFLALSSAIHADPELAFEEHRTSLRLQKWLTGHGFEVESGVAGLDTAFVARHGRDDPVIAFIAELDALPDIGHACGHNLIGAGAVVAAASLRSAIPGIGTVCVIGSPGEEGGGGKVLQLEAGVFDGVQAALMFHPADRTLTWRHSLASAHLRVTFRGVAAHAAKNPEDGRNALSAMIQLFVSLDALRQHIRSAARVHGVIRNGGSAPNVVPDLTVADFLVRDTTAVRARELVERFEACAKGAATATGTEVEIEQTAPVYSERKNNHTMADRLGSYLSSLGVGLDESSFANPAGSSDVGNLSLVVPSIHPYLQIAERGTPGHSIAFREAAGSERAQDASLLMVTALSCLGADLLCEPDFLGQVAQEFATSGPDVDPGA